MIYLKDGNIPLNLAYDDDIVQEANSTYQLSFKFPLTDKKWKELKKEVFILADDLHGEQEFFIFEVRKANGHVQVYAKQVATLLNYYSIDSISVDRVPGQTVMTALAGSVKRSCPFTFFSDIAERHTFNESNVSAMDALAKEKHSILGQWGGDLVRDKYQVKLLKNGGIENESLFMYKKNLSSYEESENINNLKTRLHLKKTIQGQSESEADRVIAVTVDSPLINQYNQIYEADIEVNDQDVTDEASLLAYGQRYFSSTLCDFVENSINLDVKGKSDVAVKMFDTVSVYHERFDVDLRLKITSYHFAPMSKRLKSIGFGKASQSVKSTVASMVAGSVDKATNTLSASFEQKLQKEIDNANQYFDAEFDKQKIAIEDGIEQAKAEAELYADNIKQSIDADVNAINTSMQEQSEEHDRQVADILSQTQSIEELANQAKTDASGALSRANQVKTEAIADARAQVATVSQALNTAKTDLQNQVNAVDAKAVKVQSDAVTLRTDLDLQAGKILEQAQAQTALTNRVTTVETLADGTKTTVAELSKTVSKATGDIASVTSRTKTVEDTLSQTRTQYEALSQTVNAQTGQIDNINRKTADLQSGIDGVTERFENLRVGQKNLILNSDKIPFKQTGANTTIVAEEDYFVLTSTGYTANSWGGVTWDLSINSVKVGEEFSILLPVYLDSSVTNDAGLGLMIKNHTLNLATFRQTISGQTDKWFNLAVTFKATRDLDLGSKPLYLYFSKNGKMRFKKPILVSGNVIPSDWSPADEDTTQQIAEYKRTADQNYAGLQSTVSTLDGKVTQNKTEANQTATQLSNRLTSVEAYKDGEGTRAQAYFEASKTETAKQLTAERTAISANYVAKSVYDEDARGTTLKLNEIKTTADTAKQNLATYQNTVDGKLEELTSSTQTLDGKINTASAKITQNAQEISKRLTSTQVEQAITDKGYATVTVLNNKVKETADSFSRTISETKALIPKNASSRNLATGSSDSWNDFVAITANKNWIKSLTKITYGDKTGIYANTNVNLFVYISADDIVLDSSVTPTMVLQGPAPRRSDGLDAWDATYNPFHYAWKVQLKSGNNYHVIKLSKTITADMYANFKGLEFQIRIDGASSGKFHWRALMVTTGDIFPSYWSPAPEDLATVTALHNVTDTVDSHTRTIGAVGTTGSILDNVSKVTQTANGLVTEVSGDNGLKTQVSTLAGSYAIKSLTKAGDVLGQINLNKDGSIKLDGSLVQITGTTYIQDGVITSAKIAGLDAGKITTGTLDAARIATNSITGSHILFDQAFFNGFTANEASLKQLFAQDAFITSVQSTDISANLISGGVLKSTNGATNFDLNNGNLLFNNNYGYIRRTANDKIFEITTLLTEESNNRPEGLSSKFMIRKSDYSRQSGIRFNLYTTSDGKQTATAQIYSDSLLITSSDSTTLFSLGSKSSFLGTVNFQGWGDIPVAIMSGGLIVKDIGISGHMESLSKVVERLCSKTGLKWM